jgi:hypothetical protein
MSQLITGLSGVANVAGIEMTLANAAASVLSHLAETAVGKGIVAMRDRDQGVESDGLVEMGDTSRTVFTCICGIKHLIQRPRPCHTYLCIVLLFHSSCHHRLQVFKSQRAYPLQAPHYPALTMTIDFNYQFNSSDADVVLLTVDPEGTTEFYVHRCILAAASLFFRDMFSLPQPETESTKKLNELPIIPVAESSRQLDTILRFIYPVPEPTIKSLDDLADVLAIAIKYDFPTVIDTLRRLLVAREFVVAHPIRVYAIACQLDLEEEAKIASSYTLNVNLFDGPPCKELKHVSAYDYHRLLALHRQRSAAALALLTVPLDLKCMQCNSSAFTMHAPPRWWFEFEKIARAELAVRPTTDVIFRMEFLFKAATGSSCTGCPESVLDSWRFLQSLKEAVDALPATVSSER